MNGRRSSIVPLVVAVVVVMVAMAGVGWFLLEARRGPDVPLTNRQRPAPAPTPSSDPARGEVRLVRSGEIVADQRLEVIVEIPPGATEMQIGLDPTFATTRWEPVADRAVVEAASVGFVSVFGRFRAGPGAAPSEVSVDGATVDPTYPAAVASADGPHRASWVRPLAPTTVVVRIEGGRLARGAQHPAGAGLDGDSVVGRDDLVRERDRLIGRPFDGERAMAETWLIGSETDPGYRTPRPVTMTARSARPAGAGRADGDRIVPLVHDLTIELPEPLDPGHRYRLQPPAELVEAIEFEIDPDRTPSPAVHVNQNGYGPDDPVKVGYLSAPSTVPVSYRAGTEFRLVAEDGTVAHRGEATARPGGDELGRGDLTGAAVFELDFSPVTEPGRYRLCVDDVGCSERFAIDPDAWRRLTVSVARAMYHQRSGLALGPPHSALARPRPYHPDDGLIVNASSYRLLDSLDAPLDEVFALLLAGAGPEVVPEAWGGHFDAGDWDRRIQHLYYTRAVAELVELHPAVFGSLSLGIPESGDPVPDLLDEGLWTLDAFRRMQRPDGAIRGGIEAAEHPQEGTTSWSDSLAVYAFAPDPWSSYLYAGVAAQVAAILEPYDRDRAADYGASALAAARWAEAQRAEPEEGHRELVAQQRAVAAVALFKLTGDEDWHRAFVEETSLGAGVDEFLACHDHTRCDAGWIYLSIDPDRTDPELRATIEASFVATADRIVAGAETTAFGFALEHRDVPLVWGLGVGGSPSAIGLLRAHALTGDDAYRAAAQRSAAVTLGANPTNTVYLTGVGQSPVAHPLIVDVMNGGLPVWPGTPVYGAHRIGLLADESWVDRDIMGPAGVTPLAADVPYLEQWFDLTPVAMFNEYTVFQSHAAAVYAFGLLAGASGAGREGS